MPFGDENREKCHQLQYFIRSFDAKSKIIVDLGPVFCFDEGRISVRWRYCPVRMYNREKTDKFCVDLFTLADSNNNFIYNLHMYLGNHQAYVGIHPRKRGLKTTQKRRNQCHF